MNFFAKFWTEVLVSLEQFSKKLLQFNVNFFPGMIANNSAS
jgi:hypothetical protein